MLFTVGIRAGAVSLTGTTGASPLPSVMLSLLVPVSISSSMLYPVCKITSSAVEVCSQTFTLSSD